GGEGGEGGRERGVPARAGVAVCVDERRPRTLEYGADPVYGGPCLLRQPARESGPYLEEVRAYRRERLAGGGVIAEEAAPALVDADDPAVPVDHRDLVRERGEDVALHRLSRAERVFRLLAGEGPGQHVGDELPAVHEQFGPPSLRRRGEREEAEDAAAGGEGDGQARLDALTAIDVTHGRIGREVLDTVDRDDPIRQDGGGDPGMIGGPQNRRRRLAGVPRPVGGEVQDLAVSRERAQRDPVDAEPFSQVAERRLERVVHAMARRPDERGRDPRQQLLE